MNSYIKQILAQRAEQVRLVHEFVESQAELWRDVPWWALQADGRTGYSDNLGRCYAYRLWTITSAAARGYYRVFVHCPTGKLTSCDSFDASKLTKLHDLDLVGVDPKQLDATRVLRELRERSEKHTQWSAKPEWYVQQAKKYGLQDPCTLV